MRHGDKSMELKSVDQSERLPPPMSPQSSQPFCEHAPRLCQTSYDNGPVSLDRQAQDRRQYSNRERVSDLRMPVSETRHTTVLTRC